MLRPRRWLTPLAEAIMTDKPDPQVVPAAASQTAPLKVPQLTRTEVEATLKGAVASANEMDLKLRAVFELSDEKASLRLG
jgi:hypothetical protein